MTRFDYDGGILVYGYRGRDRVFLFLQGKGHWDFPKGHIEKGETSLQCAIRETKEETGLDIDPDKYFMHEMTFWYQENGEKVNTSLKVYLGMIDDISTSIKLTEHSGFKWFTFTEAMDSDLFENQKQLLVHANTYINKKEELKALNEEYAKLPHSEKTWNLSRNFVPGEGSPEAQVMIIGQAPGRNEDMLLRPFVGASGKLLDEMIRVAGLKREKTYITSVVQFFPPKNRQPTDHEIAICKPFLEKQLDIISPKIVVLLGSIAAKAVIGATEIMKHHGELVEDKYFLTIHPSAAVRLKKNVAVIRQDFEKLKEIIKEKV